MTDLHWTPSPYAPFMQQCQVTLDNGIKLHVESSDNHQDPAVLLIMGLGGQLLLWATPFCYALVKQGFRVIRYDHRDIGLSTKLPPLNISKTSLWKQLLRFSVGLSSKTDHHYQLEDLAKDASLLLTALNISSCAVIGASMGGMVAQILATQYASQVERLALLFTSNNQPFSTLPDPNTLFHFLTLPPNNQPQSIIQHNAQILNLIGTPSPQQSILNLQLATQLYQRNYYPQGILQHLVALLNSGSLVQYSQAIQQPTYIIHGTHDRLVPYAQGQQLAKTIQGSNFLSIHGMGHDLPAVHIPQMVSALTQHFKP